MSVRTTRTVKSPKTRFSCHTVSRFSRRNRHGEYKNALPRRIVRTLATLAAGLARGRVDLVRRVLRLARAPEPIVSLAKLMASQVSHWPFHEPEFRGLIITSSYEAADELLRETYRVSTGVGVVSTFAQTVMYPSGALVYVREISSRVDIERLAGMRFDKVYWHNPPVSADVYQYVRTRVRPVGEYPRKAIEGDLDTMIAYLKLKTDERDWHAVSDAANDLRVMEAKA